MFFLFLFAFYFKVPEKLGRCYYLRHYDASNITNTLATSPITIVFFVDKSNILDFANYALKLFRKQINFIISDKSTAEQFNITSIPMIAQFQRSKFISTYAGQISAPFFAQWCQFILNEYHNRNHLLHPEELRIIFESKNTVLFGINQNSPPKDFRKDIPFYTCESSVFSFFNLSVKPGYYIYRRLDRQLIPVDKNYHSYIRTKIVDLENEKLNDNRLVLSYFFNPSDERNSTIEIDILQQLAAKFPDVYFAPIYQPLSRFKQLFQDLIFLQRPFVIVWNTSDITRGHRWINFDNSTINTLLGVENFLKRIQKGELPFTRVSKKSENKFELANRNFFEKIESLNKNAVVLFSNTQRGGSNAIYHNILTFSRKYFPDVSFLYFNLSHNELPAELPIHLKQPYFLLFKRNRRTSVEISIGPSLYHFFTNIVNATGNDVDLPQIDYAEVQAEIGRENEKTIRYSR